MKPSVRRLAMVVLSATLATVLLLLVFPTSASTVSPSSVDFGNPNLQNDVEISATELYEMLFSDRLSDAERTYLDAGSGWKLLYNATIPDSIVNTLYNGEEGTLQLSLPAYSYTASNGSTVTWVPTTAEKDNRKQKFVYSEETELYSCTFRDIFHTRDFDIEIAFSCSIEISPDCLNTFHNASYERAQEALALIVEYEQASAVYQGKMDAYLQYQAYLKAVADYESYLLAQAQYGPKKEAYDAYLVEYAQYQAQLQIYNTWQQYLLDLDHYYKYQEYIKNGYLQYDAYQAYLKKLDTIKSKFDIFESMFVSDSRGWQFYGSFMGGTVTSVLQNRDKLITAGCSEKDIDAAGDSTEALRPLLQEYARLRSLNYVSEHAKYQSLYNFYQSNYAAIKTNFITLYSSLKGFAGNTMVTTFLAEQGKLAHYQQFVAQLYVISSCLDDGTTYSTAWSVGSKTLTQALESIHLIKDYGNADPTGVSMPEQVAYAEEVEPIDHPGEPPERMDDAPIEPIRVAEPTVPVPVEKPNTDNPPPAAAHPGTAPAVPALTAAENTLADMLRKGTLKEHEAEKQAKALTFETTLVRAISINNRMTVTFYSEDGATVLYRKEVEYGEEVVYEGVDVKNRPATAQYEYAFRGWITADGASPNLSSIRKNLSVYPHYDKTLRSYPITWLLGEDRYTMQQYYGTQPICPFDTEKKDDEGYTYTFSGWDKETSTVTGAATYSGYFIPKAKEFTVTWVTPNGSYETKVSYEQMPVFEGDLSHASDSYLYTFSAWTPTPAPVTADVTYTARYVQSPLVLCGDGTTATVNHRDYDLIVTLQAPVVYLNTIAELAVEQEKNLVLQWDEFSMTLSPQALQALLEKGARKLDITPVKNENVSVFEVRFVGNGESEIDIPIEISLKLYPKAGDGQRILFSLEQGTALQPLSSTTHTVSGTRFRLIAAWTYSVTAEGSNNCNIYALPSGIAAGETVSLRLPCESGYEVAFATVIGADGTVIPVSSDLTFVMPQQAVHVSLQTQKTLYHVTFVVNGVVISEAYYELGQSIVYPQEPESIPRGDYLDVFVGWSRQNTIAAGDETELCFEATFNSTFQGDNPYASGHNNNKLFEVVLPIFGAVAGILIAVLVFLRVRKKKKLQSNEVEESDVPAMQDASQAPSEEAPDAEPEQRTEESTPEESAPASTEAADEGALETEENGEA